MVLGPISGIDLGAIGAVGIPDPAVRSPFIRGINTRGSRAKSFPIDTGKEPKSFSKDLGSLFAISCNNNSVEEGAFLGSMNASNGFSPRVKALVAAAGLSNCLKTNSAPGPNLGLNLSAISNINFSENDTSCLSANKFNFGFD